MGNCQAAEAATVLVVHPGGKVDRVYWSVSANEIMNSNPGHYVAQVVSPTPSMENEARPAKQLKLLRPDDTLVIGQVYRLISFEDVLKEFAAKKSVKLGKLLKERGAFNMEKKKHQSQSGLENSSTSQLPSIKAESSGGGGSGNNGSHRRHHGGSGQWRPALYSISEIGI